MNEGGGATFFVNLISEVYNFGTCESHIMPPLLVELLHKRLSR